MPGLPDPPNGLRNPGPEASDGGVVVSSRVRLARNVAGLPFVTRLTAAQRTDLLTMVRRADLATAVGDRFEWIDLGGVSALRRSVLYERNLISRQLVEADPPGAVAIAGDGAASVMVNEEDHLRLQVLRPRLAVGDAFRMADRIDDAIESVVDYAFSPRWGYLTACPTNVGCGIRLSVMLHLPALRLTNELERVRRAAKELHLAIRGFHGEGSESAGDLYQVSNQVTLGVDEQELLEQFELRLVPRLIEYELHARDMLMRDSPLLVEDRLHRAVGTLNAARLLGLEESMKLLSRVRLGLLLGRLDPEAVGADLDAVAQLMLHVQPGHLQTASADLLRSESDAPNPAAASAADSSDPSVPNGPSGAERLRRARAILVRRTLGSSP